MNIRSVIEAWLCEEDCPVHEYAWVAPKDIPFGGDVREQCKMNYCGRYGKCWMCPPGCGDWQELRDGLRKYENAFVFTTCTPLEDSYDVEGMAEGGKLHAAADEELLRRIGGGGVTYTLTGAGSCTICEKCTYPDAPCRFPDKARRSMEACGMNVVALSKLAGIHYINGQNTVTYFSALFF